MMKCLGFEAETELPDQVSFEEFQRVFALPSKRQAMRVLFPAGPEASEHQVRLRHLGPCLSSCINICGLNMLACRAVVREFLLQKD